MGLALFHVRLSKISFNDFLSIVIFTSDHNPISNEKLLELKFVTSYLGIGPHASVVHTIPCLLDEMVVFVQIAEVLEKDKYENGTDC